jgi:predicted nuclease of predicted toxin-antitoxin system
VRILLDQNLSRKLIRKLIDVLPGLESVYDHDLIAASDPFVFDWVRRSAFAAVISADRDFVLLAERLGPPPKVSRLERCDYSSAVLEQLLRRDIMRIQAFLQSSRGVLVLKL